MTRIAKKFTSETSHIVRDAVSIRCKDNIHGHSYKWIIHLEGPLQTNGMVLDFKELGFVKSFIDLFDHSTIFWEKEDSKVVDFFRSRFNRILIMKKNPTAECMARLVFKFIKDYMPGNLGCLANVVQVDVWETETGCGTATECDEDDILVYKHEDKN